MADRCNCVNAIIPKPPVCDEDCCLKACSAILSCENAVGPCGAEGSYDLTTLSHKTTGCIVDDSPSTLSYQLVSFDPLHFVSASLTSEGILTWATQGPDRVNKYGEIHFRIICSSDCLSESGTCKPLSSIGTFTVGIKDLCAGVVCSGANVCSPCNGNCIDPEANIEVSSVINNANLQVNG